MKPWVSFGGYFSKVKYQFYAVKIQEAILNNPEISFFIYIIKPRCCTMHPIPTAAAFFPFRCNSHVRQIRDGHQRSTGLSVRTPEDLFGLRG
jgi:hypothetical protein